MNVFNFRLILSVLALFWFLGCSRAPAPEPPETSLASADNNEAGDETKADSPERYSIDDASPQMNEEAFPYGAAVGSAAMRQLVNDCNRQGSFYNRVTNVCDANVALAQMFGHCQREDVMAQLNKNQVEELDAILNDPSGLQGYAFDQCVSHGQDDEYIIYFVRESDGQLTVKSVTLNLI